MGQRPRSSWCFSELCRLDAKARPCCFCVKCLAFGALFSKHIWPKNVENENDLSDALKLTTLLLVLEQGHVTADFTFRTR